MSIFIYVLSQCNVPTLFTDVALIEKFIPDNFMFSYNGYYLITLKACATYFSELK